MDLPARAKSYTSSVDLATKMQNPAVPHPLIQGRLPTRIHDQMYKIPRYDQLKENACMSHFARQMFAHIFPAFFSETYSTYNKLVTECLDEGQRGDFLKCASDCQCEMCEVLSMKISIHALASRPFLCFQGNTRHLSSFYTIFELKRLVECFFTLDDVGRGEDQTAKFFESAAIRS